MSAGVEAAASIDITAPSPPPAFAAAAWPIAAAMLQFVSITRSGVPTRDATSQEWCSLLAPIAAEGFDAVELSNRWLDLTELSPVRLAELRDACSSLGLAIPGYLVSSRSIIDPERGAENVVYTRASITAAAELGVPTVCVGLHSVAPRQPSGPRWFWTVPGSTYARQSGQRDFVVKTFRELGQHARELGVQLSIEMYPDTEVGTAERAVQLIADIAEPAVGLNPDLGNLIRVQDAVEDWETVALRTLPLTNYWHVKNYSRAEVPSQDLVLTTPAPLELGMVDYRKALRYAVSVGFSGTIVAEHYGGDGLGVSATNREYLRRLLTQLEEESRIA